MDSEKMAFVADFLSEIESGNAAIFAGAGLSVAAGFVDWRDLVRPLAEEVKLDVARETDLVAVAQFHVNANGMNRHMLHKAIVNAFSSDEAPTRNHRLLARLPISTYWTTNYDKLIETALRQEGKIVDVKSAVPQLADTRPRRDAVVYKMHGDVEHPAEAVATRDDYERYATDRGAFINALAGDLVSKTFLFLGFSFTDPNLEQVLARVRIMFQKNQRRHYAIFKTRTRLKDESDEDFANAKIRQALVVEDLKRFNIKVLLIDAYDEIPDILGEIDRRYRSRTIFVSASAGDFGPWGENAVTRFMETLGGALVSSGFRIATGLGLGVGNALFTGALTEIRRGQKGHFEDWLLLRPFPQFIADADERKAMWEAYRQDFIPAAGIGLFLFGNKIVEGKPVLADGMVREFEIARQHGLSCLPVGATGSAAAELSDRLLADGDAPEKPLMDGLKALREHHENLNQLIEPVLKLVAAARGTR